MRIYGINPVLEALRARRATAIHVSPRADERLTAVVRLAEEHDVPVRRVASDELDRLAGGARHRHQGVIAEVEEAASFSVEDLVIAAKGARSVLGEGVTVPLSVCSAKKRRDDFQIPLVHPAGLAPEVGEPQVDVQLEKLDARGSLGHTRRPYSCRRTT